MRRLCNVRCVMFNVFLLYTLHFTHCTAFAASVSSSDLINNAKQFDGKTVVYEGEVIGDVMRRGQFAWINVNDDKNAIGIWLDNSFAAEISFTGSYKSRGDKIEVTGIFHRACPEHGGDLDIHAQAIRKIANGWLLKEKLTPRRRNVALLLLGMLFLLWISKLSRRK